MNRASLGKVLVALIAGGAIIITFLSIKSMREKKPSDVLGYSEHITSSAESFSDIATPTPMPMPIPTVSLDTVFSTDHSWVRNLPSDRIVTMRATGDVIPARSVNYKMVTNNSYIWPFEKTRDILASADLTVINLETPLLESCKPTTEGMSFCGSSRSAEGLEWAGVDVATLGNNHIGNYGTTGINETIRTLEHHSITPVSMGPVIKNVNGLRFAFLSYNDIGSPEAGVPWAEKTKVAEEIMTARKEADIVVVSYHWGVEYQTEPTERQRDLAHFSIDSGADVILGNHPHWIQPVEIYNGKFIAYAHGNFIFDQEWSEETKLGVVGTYVFFDKTLVDVEYQPIRIVEYGQPYILNPEEASLVMKRFEDASRLLPPQ